MVDYYNSRRYKDDPAFREHKKAIEKERYKRKKMQQQQMTQQQSISVWADWFDSIQLNEQTYSYWDVIGTPMWNEYDEVYCVLFWKKISTYISRSRSSVGRARGTDIVPLSHENSIPWRAEN